MGIGVVVVVGSGFLALRAYDAFRGTHSLLKAESTLAAAAAYGDLACLNDSFRAAVPVGAKVFLDIQDPLSHQIAVVAAFPDRTVVASPAQATMILQLRVPPPVSPCLQNAFQVVPSANAK